MILSATHHRLLHIVCYYLIWFSCVYYAGRSQAMIGLIISIIIFSIQIFWQYRIVKDTRHLLALLIILTVCAIVIDSAMVWLNIFIYTDNYFYPYLSPPWMTMLWLEFALIVHALLESYWARPVVIGLASLIGFPLAYLGGEHLAAVTFVYGEWTAIFMGLIWMWLLPLIMYYHYRKVLTC